jgi:uncharacterized protein (DUF2384 family)
MTIQLLPTVTHDLDAPRAGVVATRLAELMGLYERPPMRRVDRELLGSVIEAAAEAGVAEQVAARRDAAAPGEATIHAFLDALIGSPRPAAEIASLLAIFGYGELERLSGASEGSLRRYAAEARVTPDPVARRVHFLATIVAILRGSFNEFGIRRWFERPHPALDGTPPAELLTVGVEPDDERGQTVLAAALALLA